MIDRMQMAIDAAVAEEQANYEVMRRAVLALMRERSDHRGTVTCLLPGDCEAEKVSITANLHTGHVEVKVTVWNEEDA